MNFSYYSATWDILDDAISWVQTLALRGFK